MKIALIVCTRRLLKWQWVSDYATLLKEACMLASPQNVYTSFCSIMPLDKARNTAAKNALNNGADYVLFLDDDVIPPPHGLKTLIEDGLPIVGGVYRHRAPPFYPLIMKIKEPNWNPYKTNTWDVEFATNYPRDQVVEVDGLGLGFTLIKREVLEKIRQPWFKFVKSGEDLYFCWKAKQAGFKTYVDTRVKCGHISDVLLTVE